MRTEKPEYQFFDADERQFLERMFEVYPTIADKFDFYLAKNPMERFMYAQYRGTPEVARAGWVRRGVPDPESINDHMGGMAKSAALGAMIGYAGEGVDPIHAAMMARLHDLPEVIVGDFTPHDGITKDDKHRLEMLAGKVLCEAFPSAYDLIKEYCNQETPTSHWVHDCDKMDAVYMALMYEARYPSLVGKLYREFADYTGPRLVTEQGKRVFAEFDGNHVELRNQWRQEFATRVNETETQQSR